MRKILCLFILISFISCKEKKLIDKNLVPDKEVYSIINFIIKNEFQKNKTNNRYLSEEFPMATTNNEYFGIEQMDTIFNKKDIEFMKLQINKRYEFRLENKLIKNRIVISTDSLLKLHNVNEKSDEFWQRFEKKYKASQFDAISLPIFSTDFKTVIISYGKHCGSLCGSGETAIYRKVNGQWKLIKLISFWKS